MTRVTNHADGLIRGGRVGEGVVGVLSPDARESFKMYKNRANLIVLSPFLLESYSRNKVFLPFRHWRNFRFLPNVDSFLFSASRGGISRLGTLAAERGTSSRFPRINFPRHGPPALQHAKAKD